MRRLRLKILLAPLLPCLLLVSVSLAQTDNSGLGVFHLRSQAPLQSIRMIPAMVSAGSVTPGWCLYTSATASNVWAQERTYYLDYEMLDIQAGIGYGFENNVGITAAYDSRTYYGGELDGLIQRFHHIFGIDQNGRDAVPKGERRVGFRGDYVVEMDANEFRNSGISLLLSWDMTPGDRWWPAVNISGSARYGLAEGEAFRDKHPVDYGFSLGFGKRLSRRWYTHLILSCTFFDSRLSRDFAGYTPLRLKNRLCGGGWALGYELSERLALLGQFLIYEAGTKGVDGLDEPTHEVYFGLKYRTDHAGVLEFALIQNVITMDNSADFGIHLGIAYPY